MAVKILCCKLFPCTWHLQSLIHQSGHLVPLTSNLHYSEFVDCQQQFAFVMCCRPTPHCPHSRAVTCIIQSKIPPEWYTNIYIPPCDGLDRISLTSVFIRSSVQTNRQWKFLPVFFMKGRKVFFIHMCHSLQHIINNWFNMFQIMTRVMKYHSPLL